MHLAIASYRNTKKLLRAWEAQTLKLIEFTPPKQPKTRGPPSEITRKCGSHMYGRKVGPTTRTALILTPTWLVDVLQRISEYPASRVAELTPRLWNRTSQRTHCTPTSANSQSSQPRRSQITYLRQGP